MPCSATVRFGLNEIPCITVDVEAHVAIMKPYDGVWLCGCVVHQHLCFLGSVGGGRSFLGANFIDRNEHGGVDGAIDVKKYSGDVLHARYAAFIKFRCGCGVKRLLHLVPVRKCKPFVGRVLKTCSSPRCPVRSHSLVCSKIYF